MKCPYCEKNGVFDNSNLNHKFKHNDDGCNHYFKVCPFCGAIYVENRYEVKDEKAIKVNNLFEIDTCIVCGKGWMPDFPTSWMRSLTNIGKIYDVIYDCARISEGKINKDVLLNLQRSHNGVVFNKERANFRGNKQYISGALGRRMSDYLLVLKNMNILKETTDSNTYEFTEFGNLFKELNDLNEIFAFLITACCNIKITNVYQKDNSGSVYKYFKIRYIENILKVCEVNEKSGNGSTIEAFGVSFLARDVKEFEDKVFLIY